MKISSRADCNGQDCNGQDCNGQIVMGKAQSLRIKFLANPLLNYLLHLTECKSCKYITIVSPSPFWVMYYIKCKSNLDKVCPFADIVLVPITVLNILKHTWQLALLL